MRVPLYYVRASGEFTHRWLLHNIKHVAKPHCRNSVPADAFIRPASVREKPAQRANPAEVDPVSARERAGGRQRRPTWAQKKSESTDSSGARDQLPFLGRGRGMGRQRRPAWAQKKSESTDSSGARDQLPFQGRGRGMGRQRRPAWAQKKSESTDSDFFCAQNKTRTCTP